jgi:hypothetical protein
MQCWCCDSAAGCCRQLDLLIPFLLHGRHAQTGSLACLCEHAVLSSTSRDHTYTVDSLYTCCCSFACSMRLYIVSLHSCLSACDPVYNIQAHRHDWLCRNHDWLDSWCSRVHSDLLYTTIKLFQPHEGSAALVCSCQGFTGNFSASLAHCQSCCQMHADMQHSQATEAALFCTAFNCTRAAARKAHLACCV